jgi:hypothetical protein
LSCRRLLPTWMVSFGNDRLTCMRVFRRALPSLVTVSCSRLLGHQRIKSSTLLRLEGEPYCVGNLNGHAASAIRLSCVVSSSPFVDLLAAGIGKIYMIIFSVHPSRSNSYFLVLTLGYKCDVYPLVHSSKSMASMQSVTVTRIKVICPFWSSRQL